jgi:hypothetical protein
MEDNFIILTYTVNRSVNDERTVLQRLGNVDFPPSSASVISRKFMKVTQLKKATVAVMLLLMFTVGGFALSQAHDNMAPGFAFSLELGFGLSHGAWEQDSYPVQFGLASEIGRVSSLIQTQAERTRLFGMVHPVRAHSLVYLPVHGPKISLHMLDSILLI